MRNLAVVACSVLFAGLSWAQPSPVADKKPATPDSSKAEQETRYLVFQVWPLLHGYPGIPPKRGHFSLSKAQMEGFVRDVVKAIGTTGDARHKLGFAVGPFSFDVSDEDTRQWIRDAFAVARENDVAVALHIDDSMGWGERKDLLSNPDNIETADWKQLPNKARSLQWGVSPTKFPPQMCYNAPAIVAAAKDRAGLIGAEIKRELAGLKSQGKEHLLAGVIAGSETQISREFGTNRPLGFRALAHRGFSESNPPKDLDAERVSVVKEWMELWANALHAAGTPREKIFCHIAFTDQGLRKADAKESHAEKVAFALPEVAFSSAYRPGFSTYPEGRTFKDIYAVLEKHGPPGWISAEGTNVSPTSMPGEPTMETYLGRVFNHGGVLVNVFSWGIGGEAQRNNFFRKATENAEALAAYAKFLRGEKLVESATGFSSEAFHAKMRRIQAELPDWVQKSGKQAQVMPLAQKLQTLIKDKKWQEADKLAGELLELMKGDQPKGEKKAAAQDIPEEARKGLANQLQGPFVVFRAKVQDDLKLTDEQKEKLEQHLKERIPDFMQCFQTLDGLKGEDREKELKAYRPKVQEKLAVFLKETLKDDQRKRLRQIEVQQEGALALWHGDGPIAKDLKITDEQRKRFMPVIQEMQKKIEPLTKEAKSGGNAQEIWPKIMKIRREHEGKIVDLLTDAQKKQWQEMVGKPLNLSD